MTYIRVVRTNLTTFLLDFLDSKILLNQTFICQQNFLNDSMYFNEARQK